MKIIVISGKQGAGKTTLQNALVDKIYRKTGTGSVILNFADPIKEMHDECRKILARYYDDKRNLAKDGDLLQLLGTEWARTCIADDIWIQIMRRRVERAIGTGGWAGTDVVVIIGDCRFKNEFDAFPEALRIRLEAPEYTRKQRCSMWRDRKNHPSEIGLDDVAAAGEFDLYLDTGQTDADGCLSLAWVAFDKGSWVERRKS